MDNNGRIQILAVKYGMSDSGVACGPMDPCPLYSVKYRMDGKEGWLHNYVVTGVPNYFITEEDIHEKLLDDDYVDANIDYLNSIMIQDFAGLRLCDFESMVDCIEDNQNNPAVPFIRFLLRIYNTVWEEIDALIESAVGKYADEVPLPPYDYDSEMELVDW